MTRANTASKAKRGRSAHTGMIRTYRSALNFLGEATDYEHLSRVKYNHQTFNLARMNRLTSALGHPERKLKTVHIAGTKGKGSTVAMLSSMLQGCGYDVGAFTSPHVLDIRERITINDTWISEQEFTKLVSRIAPFARSLKGTKPTFFELITAMAFLYFAEKGVDIALIEAGLGGRLDCTNIIRPEVCGLTGISFDHTELLGQTLESIAAEKGGILKTGVPAISVPQSEEAKKTLLRIAKEKDVILQFAGDEIEFSCRFESSRIVGPHTRVCVTTQTSRFEHMHVPLLGEHQAMNCGLALGLLDALKMRGFEFDVQDAIQGLAKVNLPGRMEFVSEQPKILVDGAHNGASIEALMRTIGQHVPYDSMIVIFGCQQGKDIEGMIRHIQLGADKIIFTKSSSPNAVEPSELAASYVEQSGQVAQTAQNLDEALRIAQGAVTTDDVICITGSFYLVGDAKKRFSA